MISREKMKGKLDRRACVHFASALPGVAEGEVRRTEHMIAVFDDVALAQLSRQGLGVGAGNEDAGEMPWPKPYDAPALLERVSLNGHVAVLRKLPVWRQHCTRKRNKETMLPALCYTASLS